MMMMMIDDEDVVVVVVETAAPHRVWSARESRGRGLRMRRSYVDERRPPRLEMLLAWWGLGGGTETFLFYGFCGRRTCVKAGAPNR